MLQAPTRLRGGHADFSFFEPTIYTRPLVSADAGERSLGVISPFAKMNAGINARSP